MEGSGVGCIQKKIQLHQIKKTIRETYYLLGQGLISRECNTCWLQRNFSVARCWLLGREVYLRCSDCGVIGVLGPLEGGVWRMRLWNEDRKIKNQNLRKHYQQKLSDRELLDWAERRLGPHSSSLGVFRWCDVAGGDWVTWQRVEVVW